MVYKSDVSSTAKVSVPLKSNEWASISNTGTAQSMTVLVESWTKPLGPKNVLYQLWN